MSKIGMRPISVNGANVKVEGPVVTVSHNNKSFSYDLPNFLNAELLSDNTLLKVSPISDAGRGLKSNKLKMLWGMHRALLANKIEGITKGFKYTIKITGLGYKAIKKSESELELSLGYSHKCKVVVDPSVAVEIDKSGQNLVVTSHDKELLGLFCSRVRSLKAPEPYKGTGITVNGETIIAKAGKSAKA